MEENTHLDDARNWIDDPEPFYLGPDTAIYPYEERIERRLTLASLNLRAARIRLRDPRDRDMLVPAVLRLRMREMLDAFANLRRICDGCARIVDHECREATGGNKLCNYCLGEE